MTDKQVALRRAVAALEMVTDQNAIKNTTTINAFAACIEAAAIGRKALADQNPVKSCATPEAETPAVRVKALVWEERGDHRWAADALHRMIYINEYSGMPEPFQLDMQAIGNSMFPTLEAAKAAAQADYEARILSALEPAPVQGWRADQFLRFAYRVMWQVANCQDVDSNDLAAAILYLPDDLKEKFLSAPQDGGQV